LCVRSVRNIRSDTRLAYSLNGREHIAVSGIAQVAKGGRQVRHPNEHRRHALNVDDVIDVVNADRRFDHCDNYDVVVGMVKIPIPAGNSSYPARPDPSVAAWRVHRGRNCGARFVRRLNAGDYDPVRSEVKGLGDECLVVECNAKESCRRGAGQGN
jgi:hypothetical protein